MKKPANMNITGKILATAFIFAALGVLPTNTSAQAAEAIQSAPATIVWPEIKAQSAFVFNPLTYQVLYAKNPDTPRPTASLLKVMTAGVVNKLFNMSPALVGKYVTIPKMTDENSTDRLLLAGSKWAPEDLLKMMLVGSSNKAAETLANGLIPKSSFMSLMNFEAKRMGLSQTYFRNPSGLSISTSPTASGTMSTPTSPSNDIAGGVSTAREIALMFWKVISENPGLLDVTHEESVALNPSTTNNPGKLTVLVNNTNKILKNFPIMFGKTGFTTNAGGNLAVVLQKDQRSTPYIIVVLGSTADERFTDVAALASTTMQLEMLQISAGTSTAVAAK